MSRPTFLSLFAGIGGLDLGLERAGWRCVGQVEIDPFCRRVLAKHWPDVPRWGDIREVSPDDLPRADLICGGFPCQPVSTAGRRRGQADERWLWPEFARAIRHLRPGWVLVENVPGLLARGMGDVLGDLAGVGYDAEWRCLSAADVGAPHLRERVWIVAYPELRGRDGLHERRQPRHLATDAGGSGANGPGRPAAEGDSRGVPREGTQGSNVPDPERQQLRDEPGRRNGQDRPGQAVAGDDGPARFVAHTEGDGRPRSWPAGAGQPAGGWPEPVGGREALANSNGRSPFWAPVARPERHPWRAEPVVGRVAHGVPARVDRLRALGNAVVPQVAELIGRRILAGSPSEPSRGSLDPRPRGLLDPGSKDEADRSIA
jgi:DNA (cytosine-5)-methyltransferase 1